MSLFASFDFANPVGSVETLIQNAIASKYPDLAAKHPKLAAAINAAIVADTEVAMQVLETYVLAKAETMIGPILSSIAAKVPVLAPEIAVIQAKIAAGITA